MSKPTLTASLRRARALGLLLTMVPLCSSMVLAGAQPPSELWVAGFDGGGVPFASDVLFDVAINAAGEICATGTSVTTGGAFAATTVLFEPNGSERWRRFYVGPQSGGNESGLRAFLGPDGTCVVAGELSTTDGTGPDVLILAYGAAGGLEWDASYDAPGSGFDTAVDVTADAAGNVFVAAQSSGAGTGWDLVSLKLDSTGNLLWSRVYDGPASGDDQPVGIAVDGAGSVYVAGTAGVANPFGDDLILIKYDAAGDELWTTLYDGGVDGTDVAGALGLDGVGNVYVAGRILAPPGTEWEAGVVKFLSDGTPQWTALAGHPAAGIPEEVRGVALHDDGSSYLVATGSNDVLAARFDSAGELVWDHLSEGVSIWGSASRPLALDDLGNAHVAAFDFVPGDGLEFLTYRLAAATGALDWSLIYGEAGDDADDRPAAIGLDSSGAIVVGGTVTPGGQALETDWAVVKYGSSLIFEDGFESGDLSAWSASNP